MQKLKHLKSLLPKEIIFLEADANYTKLFTEDGKMFISSFTLGLHHERLESFIRISRKHLLNPSYVSSYKLEDCKPKVKLKSGSFLNVSRRRVKKLTETIAELRSITSIAAKTV